MNPQYTPERFLELLEKQAASFDTLLKKERLEREKATREFNKKLGQISNTRRQFVTEMVTPRLVKLFQKKGLPIELSAEKVKGFKNGTEFYEIDLLLVNSVVAVAVEVKSKLDIEGVNEHLERLQKIMEVSPRLVNLSGMTIFGAVAGMIVIENADKYAYRKGLYVLRQKGNNVEIVNGKSFEPLPFYTNY